MDDDLNVKAVASQFYNTVNLSNICRSTTLLGLTKGRYTYNQVMRRQGIIGKNIREITAFEMELVVAMEVKATIVHNKGEKYYTEWLKKNQQKYPKKY